VIDPSDAPSDRSTVESRFIYLPLAILSLAMVVARRNLRTGRGDREGARRIAVFAAFWLLVGHGLREPSRLEAPLVMLYFMNALFYTVASWVTYLALEPIVRRRWPGTLVSWTRLLRGRLLDPLVGRALLIGVLGGVASTLIDQVGSLVQAADFARWPGSPERLAGGWNALGNLITDCGSAVLFCLAPLMLLALLRQVLRKTWAAFLVTVGLIEIGLGSGGLLAAAVSLPLMGLFVGLLIRPGLLATAAAASVSNFLGASLVTTHLGAWYADSAVSGILATLALAAWGFYAALGGRPLLGDSSREIA